MKKSLILTASVTLIALSGFSQQFGGSTTQTGAIFRAGTLGLGVTSVPTGVDFIARNSTNKSGKFVLGNSALFGAYTASESVIQAYNLNGKKSRLSLVSASTSTNNLSLALDIDMAANAGVFLSTSVPANKKPFVIDMYGTNAIIVNTTGQVGVGTGTTSLGTMKLAVNGTIGAREVKVTLASPWPDYVFNKNYKRKSFEELASYIESEQHLPYIKSAKEIETNGNQSLGETQLNIVRSLEELYLYVLDLKKENEILKKQIEVLQNTK